MKADNIPSALYRRVVVDTNVLLSAALSPRGVPAKLLDHLLIKGALVFSAATFAELETRLWKPKFDRYLSIEHRRQLLHDFNASSFWVEIPDHLARKTFSRDADDDAFIHTALTAEASRLVSGDDDLLCLSSIGSLLIMSPRMALDEILVQETP